MASCDVRDAARRDILTEESNGVAFEVVEKATDDDNNGETKGCVAIARGEDDKR